MNRKPRKLLLNRETVRVLDHTRLSAARGAGLSDYCDIVTHRCPESLITNTEGEGCRVTMLVTNCAACPQPVGELN